MGVVESVWRYDVNWSFEDRARNVTAVRCRETRIPRYNISSHEREEIYMRMNILRPFSHRRKLHRRHATAISRRKPNKS